MLRHYLSTAYRALRRYAGYSLINVSGLAVGMACCLLILVYITEEVSYDRFHEKSDRIVRLALETKSPGGEWEGRVPAFYQLADMVGSSLSGVEEIVRIAKERMLLAAGSRRFLDEGVLLASSNIFDVFSLNFVDGSPRSALAGPNTAVLTEDAARRFFGDEDPIGKVITSDNRYDYEVTGVVRALPRNSHVHFDVLLNLESMKGRYSAEMFESMGAQWIYTYLLLSSPEPADQITARVNSMMAQFLPPDLPVEARLVAQPLTSIHLNSHFDSELEPNGNITYLYLFGAIAVFILVIACVNFMNLATARASTRAREVGVRKVLGAHRNQLVRQFLAESTILSLFAVGLSVPLAALFLPILNSVTGKELSTLSLGSPAVLGSLVAIAVLVGLLSGAYPSLFLSSFRPARVLKGGMSSGRRGFAFRLRQALVVFQFALSIAIVLGTLIVIRQLQYVQRAQPGFDREQVLSVRLPASSGEEQIASLKEAFTGVPGIQSVSAASHAPPEGLNSARLRPAGTAPDRNELVAWIAVDYDYIKTLGLRVSEGRPFDRDHPSDAESSIVINQAMARHFGLEHPVGSQFDLNGGLLPTKTATVIGVLSDFHQASMHEEIRPVFLYLDTWARQILLKVEAGRAPETIDGLAAAWTGVVNDWPFEYSFLDDQFDALYRSEAQLGTLFGIFSFLAIFIACMGLFGLSAYMTERRKREVGVRKVFGASPSGVVHLLTREFLILVLLAFGLSAPITTLAMRPWLESFAYRAETGPGLYVLAAGLALLIAGLTVSYQAIRASRMNPIDSLRHD